MKIARILGIFVFGLLFCCQKQEPFPIDHIGNQAGDASLRISVRYLYQISPEVKDSLLPGTDVRLYLSTRDRDDELNRLAERSSDSLGMVHFESLNPGLFYIRLRHPRFGVLDDSVKLISGSLSQVEELYY